MAILTDENRAGMRMKRWPVVILEGGSGEDGGGNSRDQRRPTASDNGGDRWCPVMADIGGIRRRSSAAASGGGVWRRLGAAVGGYWCTPGCCRWQVVVGEGKTKLLTCCVIH
ncbi:unnamed protein product [Cuscuta epithymum]|uniref:Uncharacterized protein n=1 Tax=Cuscuta epithymum TaxID=186058 RepID=A0AAV0FKK8_9ASTE|nr:unnamed protein product [Cuscuta epithymum]